MHARTNKRTDPLPSAEWREITVVNVDLGAATFSEGIELGALALVMSERLTAIITIAAAWDGIVNGCADGRTAIIFSIPQPGMQRATAGIALEAALEIRGKLSEASVFMPRGNEPAEWRPRISLASGPCIVGTFVGTFVGNTTQFYAAIGPAVHVASVLHATTSPGAIVCDHATWLLVNDCVQGPGIAQPAAAAARDLPRHYEISGFAPSARPSITIIPAPWLVTPPDTDRSNICAGFEFPTSSAHDCLQRGVTMAPVLLDHVRVQN